MVHHDFCGMVTDKMNRKIANQGKEEVIITVTVADSFSDLDLVVEAFELAGAIRDIGYNFWLCQDTLYKV